MLETSREIVKGAGNDLEKARAICEWIGENTFRDPNTRGCGIGDIRGMLETRSLGGKCADLNALGLTRAAGVRARDLYGIRTADSREFKSLGKSATSPRRSTAAPSSTWRATAICVSCCGRTRARFRIPCHGGRRHG